MSSNGAFVLPAGVRLTMEGGALSIANAGDIVIEGAPAQELRTLRSERGDVRLAPPGAITLDSVEAPNGTVTVSGDVTLDAIVARAVNFASGSLKASVLKASESIALAGGRLEVHVVVAPQVDVNAAIKGRATAIESQNELGPHKLKGGFSLAEFVDFLPEGAAMLSKHGIAVPEGDADGGDADEERSAAGAGVAGAAAAVGTAAISAGAGLGPVVSEALDKIVAAYSDRDVPPPIDELSRLVAGGDVAALKQRINPLWSELLKHSQQSEPFYLPNTVTGMFQKIQLELRKA